MNENKIRERVSTAYAEAVRRAAAAQDDACCTPTCCSSKDVEPAGAAARFAGYGEELGEHADAAKSSFGCGNPLAFAEVGSGETVLDLGSGAGFDLLIAADRVGPEGRVIGVDMTDAMIETARAHARAAGADQIEVRKGVIEAMPVETDSVDWVISNCVINLSPEKARVFAEIKRVLKPGGRFSISDIVAEGLPQALLDSVSAYAACVAGAISEAAYVKGLESAGLVDVQVTDRFAYGEEEIGAMIQHDFSWAGGDGEAPLADLDKVAGKVASVRFTGRVPGSDDQGA